MSRIPSNTFQSNDAVALGAFNDRLLRDCGLSRCGEDVLAAVDDPRVVRVSKPGLLDQLFNAARTATRLRTAHT